MTLTFPPNTITRKIKKARLDINFTGVISDKLRGLYRSTYSTSVSEEDGVGEESNPAEDEENDKKLMDASVASDSNHGYKYYATTQFEAIDARRAFPCFDEPALKATFNVSIIADQRLTALSNGRERSSEILSDADRDANGDSVADKDKIVKKRTTFEKTPKMSTYLLAFIVGSFDKISGTTASGVAVDVFTPVGRSSEGSFALDIAIKSLDYFEQYFGIKYPMKKCDQVSINDFSAGMLASYAI